LNRQVTKFIDAVLYSLLVNLYFKFFTFLFKTDAGIEFHEGQAIFPIIVLIPEIQTLSNNETVTRVANEMVFHPSADIAVGMLFKGYDEMAKEKQFEPAPHLTLSFKTKFAAGERVVSYRYPKTELEINNLNYKFTFTGKWSEEILADLLEESPLVKNQCLQTAMSFDSGASGGPDVFKDGKVIGINSGSIEIMDGEGPISYITPIKYLLNMKVRSGENFYSIKQLVEEKYITGLFD